MMDLEEIFEFYKPQLDIVEDRLRDLFKSPVFPILLIGKHLIDGGGKRLRPLILILSAEIAGCKGDERLTLAGIIESIHTASLLHDDVVDGADIRRGKEPAHSFWGNQVVILVGDYLYSNALKHAFPDGRDGEIHLRLRAEQDQRVTLSVADDGVGLPAKMDFDASETLGLQLIRVLTSQLGGTVELQGGHENGMCVSITFAAP